MARHIPDHVFYDRHKCADLRACIQQNGDIFGFVPLTAMQSYTKKLVHWETIPDIYSSHTIIKESGLPNVLGHRIPVNSQLKPHTWHFHLRDFSDKQLPDLIEFRFPLDFDRQNALESTETNHASSLDNTHHIDSYFAEETSYKAMHNPFTEKPFPLHVLPLRKENSP